MRIISIALCSTLLSYPIVLGQSSELASNDQEVEITVLVDHSVSLNESVDAAPVANSPAADTFTTAQERWHTRYADRDGTLRLDRLYGTLIRFDFSAGVILRTQDNKVIQLATRDVVRIDTQLGSHQSDHRTDTFLFCLVNRDIIRGRVVGERDSVIQIAENEVGMLDVSFDSLASLSRSRWLVEGVRTYDEGVGGQQATGRVDQKSDQVWLRNGDRLEGLILALKPDGLDFAAINADMHLGEEVHIPYSVITEARFAGGNMGAGIGTSLVKEVNEGLRGILTLRSGTRLTLSEVHWSGGQLKGRHQFDRFGATLNIGADQLVRLEIAGGRWEWLTRRLPISTVQTPMLSLDWPHHIDRNVLGQPLCVGGKVFDHGIGVHSHSRLRYDLKGQYGHFVCSFGMDDDSGPLADVSVIVMIDGIEKFSQNNVCQGNLYGPLSIDVLSANSLELIIDFGDNGDVQDRFDWIEPMLIKP